MKQHAVLAARCLRQSKLLRLFAKVGLTLFAFWFVFRGVDFAQLNAIFKKQNHTMLLVAVALMLCQVVLGALRWRLILRALGKTGHDIMTAMESVRIYYISIFFNCCLPGTVGGDVVRVWMTKSDHISLSLAIHSVVIDRIIALAALGVLIVVTLPLLGAAAGFNAWLLLPLIAVAGAAGVWLLYHMDRLLARFREVRVIHWLLYFADSLRMLLKYPLASTASLAYAIIGHLCFCLCGYVLAQSLGIDITFIQCITLIPPVTLAATLPISIGGWGIREAGMVSMLSLAGVSQAAALMLSIQFGLVNIAICLPAGILWLICRRHSSARPSADAMVQQMP